MTSLRTVSGIDSRPRRVALLDQARRTAHLAWHLARADVGLRYRRSFLGPFWFTLNAALYMAVIGIVYSLLWKQPADDFMAWFVTGYTVWLLVVRTVTEGCNAFLEDFEYIRNLPLPYLAFPGRVVLRNALIFAHFLPIYLVIVPLVGIPLAPDSLLVLPGLLLLLVVLSGTALFLAVVCLRFRDFGNLIESLVFLVFLVTPILWQPAQLGDHRWVVDFNPVHHLVELVRAPLLGRSPAALSWLVGVVASAASLWAGAAVFRRARARIPFWN